MKTNERLYLTAEGQAEMLKADWFKTLNNITDIMTQLEDGYSPHENSPLSPYWEAQMALKEDLEIERQKHDIIGRRYYEIKGAYPDGLPF